MDIKTIEKICKTIRDLNKEHGIEIFTVFSKGNSQAVYTGKENALPEDTLLKQLDENPSLLSFFMETIQKHMIKRYPEGMIIAAQTQAIKDPDHKELFDNVKKEALDNIDWSKFTKNKA